MSKPTMINVRMRFRMRVLSRFVGRHRRLTAAGIEGVCGGSHVSVRKGRLCVLPHGINSRPESTAGDARWQE